MRHIHEPKKLENRGRMYELNRLHHEATRLNRPRTNSNIIYAELNERFLPTPTNNFMNHTNHTPYANISHVVRGVRGRQAPVSRRPMNGPDPQRHLKPKHLLNNSHAGGSKKTKKTRKYRK
jgi:hypothetical protein